VQQSWQAEPTDVAVCEEGAVLHVVLNRPDRQNSIDGPLIEQLVDALDRAERRPQLRVLCLRATGPVFCSGMDLGTASASRWPGPDGPDSTQLTQEPERDPVAAGGQSFFDLLDRLSRSPLLVVAMVDGRVAGGGVGLVAASDIAVATEGSTFGLPEALWGLLPCVVLPFLIRRIGPQPARAMTLSTLPVAAGRAAQLGLVDEVVADSDTWLRRLVARVTRVDRQTVADGKRYLDRLAESAGDQREVATREFARLMSSPAAVRRIGAFTREGRMPWETGEAAAPRPR
jgi:polyketide biosynthesis enoyl-CoA hydratase PksH